MTTLESRPREFPVGPFFSGLLASAFPYLALFLDRSRVLLTRDLSNLEIPLKMEWLRAIRETGGVPHWNPAHASGFPFLSDPNSGPLYPLNALFLLFSEQGVARGLIWFIVLHHFLLYCGGFVLTRELRVRPHLAAAAGLAFTWCGYSMSCDITVNMLCSLTAMPFLWLLCLRARRKGLLSSELLWGGLALSWPLYAGDPQFSYLGMFSALWILRPKTRSEFTASGQRIAILGFSSLLTALPQLLPIAIHFADSERFASQGSGQLFWSLHPIRALEAFFPLAFGPDPDPRRFFGAAFLNTEHTQMPFIFSCYSGAFLTGGLLLAGFRKRARWSIQRLARFAFFLIVPLVCFGSFSPLPLYSFFAKLVPFWGQFRYPERLVFWFSFPWILLAVLSWERLLRLPRLPRPAAISFLAAPPALLLLLVLHRQGAPLQPVLIGVTFLLLALFSGRIPSRAQSLAVAALIGLDFLIPATQLVWTQPADLLSTESLPLVRRIFADEGGRSGWEARRLVSFKYPHEVDLSRLGEISTLTVEAAETWGYLRYNVPGAFRLESAQGHSPLLPEAATSGFEGPNQQRELNLRSVRYIVRQGTGGPDLAINESALPYAFLPRKVEFVTETMAREKMYSSSWNPTESALLESSATSNGAWSIVALHKTWDKISVELKPSTAPGSGWLVLNENYSRFWKVEGALELARANGWAIGVRLPPPDKTRLTLNLRYREPGFPWVWFAPAFWLTALLTVLQRRRCLL